MVKVTIIPNIPLYECKVRKNPITVHKTYSVISSNTPYNYYEYEIKPLKSESPMFLPMKIQITDSHILYFEIYDSLVNTVR